MQGALRQLSAASNQSSQSRVSSCPLACMPVPGMLLACSLPLPLATRSCHGNGIDKQALWQSGATVASVGCVLIRTVAFSNLFPVERCIALAQERAACIYAIKLMFPVWLAESWEQTDAQIGTIAGVIHAATITPQPIEFQQYLASGVKRP